LNEFERARTLNIRHFYVKRILRIWPLYYLCVLLGFVVLGAAVPHIQGKNFFAFTIQQGLPYYIFFLPNYIASAHTTGVGALYGLWSIGVEEQFYLFFPFLMLFVLKSRRPVLYITAVTLAYTAFYYLQYYRFIHLPVPVSSFINTLKYQFMLIGCTAAILYKKRPVFIRTILPPKKRTQAVLLGLMCVILFFNLPVNYGLYSMLSGLLYACVIINTFGAPVHLVNFEAPWLSYLGKISYGIYMFHPYLGYLLRYAIIKFGWVRSLFTAAPVLYYALLLLVTVAVAHTSYKYYESRFLKMKPL
jgi:peptidoglycan/LPS O-acetylase OafA/YrhL